MSSKPKQPAKKWSEMNKQEKRAVFMTLAVFAIVIIFIISATSGNNKSSTATTNNSQPVTTTSPQPTVTKPAVREVAGALTTLGTGTFTGGSDVPNGLYDVTTSSGQSGNFIVSGPDSVNEILGANSIDGVSKIRTQISAGDSIKISDLSSVTFTPVSDSFVTAYQTTSLYTGTFKVGEDIGAGRYIATTTAGSSGNFIVNGPDTVNEILGQNSIDGVPSVTVNLTAGDVIEISALEQVTLTPTK